MPAPEPVIAIEALEKSYGSNRAVNAISFEVAVLTGILVVCGAISARFFRWE